MNDYLSNNVKKEMDKIKIPEDKLNQAIEFAIKRGKKNQRSLGKKVIYFSSAAVLLFGLLIGSTFVSPAMAKVVSKIPYLGQIFESKSLIIVISEELRAKGYNTISTGIRYESEKIVEVSIDGSDDYYNEVKDDVEKIVNGILKSRGYDAYSVKVNKFVPRSDYVLNDKEAKEKNALEGEVTKKLRQLDYKFDMVQVDPTEKAMFINIVGSKKYYNTIQDAVEKVAKEIAETNHYTGYKIKVTRVTTEVRVADKASEIISVVTEGLISKKEYKVTGVGYKSKPLRIMINTSVQSSNPTAKELAMKIETEINEFLKSEDVLSILGDETYEIIVYSKDKKKIN
jgi:hypothetical protein